MFTDKKIGKEKELSQKDSFIKGMFAQDIDLSLFGEQN